MNFQEASEVAKRNPGSILSRDESGEFYVRGPGGEPLGGSPLILPGLADALKERETRIAQLEQELLRLRLNIDAEIESILKPRQESIEAEWVDLQKLKLQLQRQVEQTEASRRKLILLEKAYAERFGEAEVKEVSVTVESRDVCSRCGGDGGVNGGCGRCDGTGWAISQHKTVREEVQFK